MTTEHNSTSETLRNNVKANLIRVVGDELQEAAIESLSNRMEWFLARLPIHAEEPDIMGITNRGGYFVWGDSEYEDPYCVVRFPFKSLIMFTAYGVDQTDQKRMRIDPTNTADLPVELVEQIVMATETVGAIN